MSLNIGKKIIYESSDTDEEIQQRQRDNNNKNDDEYVLEIELDDEELMNVDNDISTTALETLVSAAAANSSKKTGSSSNTSATIVMAQASKMKSTSSQEVNGTNSSRNVTDESASKTSKGTSAKTVSSDERSYRLNPLFEKFLCVITTDKEMQEKMRRDFHEERFIKVREKYSSVRGPRRGRWGEAEHKIMSKYLDMIEDHDPMPLVSLEGPYVQHEINEETGEIKHKTNLRLLRHFLAIMLARSIETFNQEWNRQKEKNKQRTKSKFVENGINLQSMMESGKLTEFWNSYPSKTPKQESDEKIVLRAMEKVKELMTKYQERHRDMIQHLKNHKATNNTPIPPLESSAPSFDTISEQAREILSQLQSLEKDYQIDLHSLLWKSITPAS
jgi:hypothetical protein